MATTEHQVLQKELDCLRDALARIYRHNLQLGRQTLPWHQRVTVDRLRAEIAQLKTEAAS